MSDSSNFDLQREEMVRRQIAARGVRSAGRSLRGVTELPPARRGVGHNTGSLGLGTRCKARKHILLRTAVHCVVADVPDRVGLAIEESREEGSAVLEIAMERTRSLRFSSSAASTTLRGGVELCQPSNSTSP